MKIYTRTGDEGETSLLGAERISKADPRVDAYGDIDELNAWIGVIRAAQIDPDLDAALTVIQRDLFAAGSQVADPGKKLPEHVTKAFLTDAHVTYLEQIIDRLESELRPLTHFILAGGSAAAAAAHVCRTVCRRAERHMVGLTPAVDGVIVRYLNRLSDLLFVLARVLNHRAGVRDVEWS